jgi:hypothetical protein
MCSSISLLKTRSNTKAHNGRCKVRTQGVTFRSRCTRSTSKHLFLNKLLMTLRWGPITWSNKDRCPTHRIAWGKFESTGPTGNLWTLSNSSSRKISRLLRKRNWSILKRCITTRMKRMMIKRKIGSWRIKPGPTRRTAFIRLLSRHRAERKRRELPLSQIQIKTLAICTTHQSADMELRFPET